MKLLARENQLGNLFFDVGLRLWLRLELDSTEVPNK
jgi:hypothetical protein